MKIKWFLFASTLLTGAFLFGVSVILATLVLQEVHTESMLSNVADFIALETGYFFSVGLCLIGLLFRLQINKLKQTWE